MSVPEFAIDEPLFIVMVPEDGIKDFVGSTVNAPATEKEAVGWDEGVPEIVNPLKVNVPELTIDQPVPDIVIVPEDGAKVFVELTVNAPATENELVGCVEGVSEIVKFLNVNVPVLAIDQSVVVIVMVPADGAKVTPMSTYNNPLIEKELVGCDEGVSEMVSPLKVNVPELTMDQPVPVIAMVPADGIKDFVELTVNAPEIENEAVG